MKTNGREWKAYLNSWPEGQWFDDSDEKFDGKEPDADPADDAAVEFTTGVIYRDRNDRYGVNLVRHFRAWQKAQTHRTVLVSVPRDKMNELKAAVKALGGKTHG